VGGRNFLIKKFVAVTVCFGLVYSLLLLYTTAELTMGQLFMGIELYILCWGSIAGVSCRRRWPPPNMELINIIIYGSTNPNQYLSLVTYLINLFIDEIGMLITSIKLQVSLTFGMTPILNQSVLKIIGLINDTKMYLKMQLASW